MKGSIDVPRCAHGLAVVRANHLEEWAKEIPAMCLFLYYISNMIAAFQDSDLFSCVPRAGM